ncbi:MAG: hypothetical protein AAFV53_35530 [Myxococcota bacterium]
MDIWAWLTEEYRRYIDDDPLFAFGLVRLPSTVVDNNHTAVESTYAHLMGKLREKPDANPWLELFLRHWRLQSMILRRHQINEGMPLAIELIEMASRDEYRDCPQSICAAQDLCVAYGHLDGPGFAEERIQVSRETLSRINPSWPCWICIHGELAGAMLDLGRYAEVLEQVREMHVATAPYDREKGFSVFTEVHALQGLGRLDEALQILRKVQHADLGDGYVLEWRMWMARILAQVPGDEDPRAYLPRWDEVHDTASNWGSFAQAMWLIGDWDDRLFVQLSRGARRLVGQGAVWDGVDLSFTLAEHALHHHQRDLARGALDRIAQWLPRLHVPSNPQPRLQAALARLNAMADDPFADGELRVFAVRGHRLSQDDLDILSSTLGQAVDDWTSDEKRPLPGTTQNDLRLNVAWPHDQPLEALDQILSRFAAGRGALLWPDLLQHIDRERAAEHRARLSTLEK